MTASPPVRIPAVAATTPRSGLGSAIAGLAIIGFGVFGALSISRAAHGEQIANLPPLPTYASTEVAPKPEPAITAPPVAPVAAVPERQSPVMRPPAPRPSIERPAARADTSDFDRTPPSPALVVDLAQARTGDPSAAPSVVNDGGTVLPTVVVPDPTAAAIAAAGAPPGAAPATTGAARDLNANERFAVRTGNRQSDTVQAERLPNQDRLVVEGTIIGAVMETALDSDLPGYARAIVSRDVLSFDGSTVMIPAGSRVIGEYNSGVAQGASRIFIVWNRLIRPDGVSVALASPAVDDLGRGGLAGKVNRHFLQRFGGAILLSVLTGGINAATQAVSSGSTVVVGTPADAAALANQASRGTDIAPTIKTQQGINVRIFVARDLDFSTVGPAP